MSEFSVLPLLGDCCCHVIEPLVHQLRQLGYRPGQRIERCRHLVHLALDRLNALRQIVNPVGHRRALRRVYHRRFARLPEHDACPKGSSNCPKDFVDWLATVAQTATVVPERGAASYCLPAYDAAFCRSVIVAPWAHLE